MSAGPTAPTPAPMPVRRLGHSGLEVSPLALGTMMFGTWGNTDADECRAMVDRALDAGITMFDTADIYDSGVSEEILGSALRGRRDRVVLATKCGNPMGDDPDRRGLSARWVGQACEDSLRRLGVDHIDLYQMHRPDPLTPIEETLAAFDALVQAGKIRAVGTSTFSADQLLAAQRAAGELGLVAPTSEQPPYSALARGIEREVLPACRAHDVGVVVWAPLNGGWLTGKYQTAVADAASRAIRSGEHFDHRDDAVRTNKVALVDRLTTIAADFGLTLVQLALGFVLDDPTVTAAIIGPRTLAQLDELV
ncbi:MAG: putative aldo/keto reductase, partial [Ilumatobacteraceae bacterium]|nr:putative aldo/keto reductase [Ilumatobacteraceae bacterium]